MKKAFALILSFLLALLLLAGCASKPPEGVDVDAAEATAKEVIDTMNARDYEALTSLFRADLQDMVPPESWEVLDPTLDEFGSFESYGKVSYVDKGDDSGYGHLFSAIVECNYQNNAVTIEVVMDTDLAVTGLSFLQVK